MRVLVTGASGFLGRSVVRQCAEAGHETIALIRPLASTERLGWPSSVQVIRGDLRQRGDWCAAMGNVDAVIHLAAGTSGGLPDQLAASVVATENLLACLTGKRLQRFVHCSTFSVYDVTAARGRLTEESPLETHPERRAAYTWTKLVQEKLVRDWAEAEAVPLAILRPGQIFGPGKLWDEGAAVRAGSLDLIFAPFSRMRLTHVDNCAAAFVRALDSQATGVFNIVDDDLPTHASYHRQCIRAGAKTGIGVYIPWFLVVLGGLMVRLINKLFFRGRAKLPELLDLPRQRARWKPLRYSNARAKAELGWSPALPMREAIRHSVQASRG